jgi:hypothetical protein
MRMYIPVALDPLMGLPRRTSPSNLVSLEIMGKVITLWRLSPKHTTLPEACTML